MSSELVPRRAELASQSGFRPRNLDELQTLGELMTRSGMFPEIKDKAQAAMKVLAGMEMGIGPIASMRGFHVYMNRLEPSAELRAALIKRSGRYDFRILEHTNEACEIEFYEYGERRGAVRYTVDDADRAGLRQRNQVWRMHPADMVYATAVRKGSRRYCGDLFLGVPGVDEHEAHDDAHVVTDVERPALMAESRALQVRVLAACRELGWDDARRHRETARLMQGRTSLTDLDDDELERLLAEFGRLLADGAGETNPSFGEPREEDVFAGPVSAPLVIAGITVEPVEVAEPALTDDDLPTKPQLSTLNRIATEASIEWRDVLELFAARHGVPLESARRQTVQEFGTWFRDAVKSRQLV